MKYVIDDDTFKRLLKARIHIRDIYYHVTTDIDFVVGDVILDRMDGCRGVIERIKDDKAAVRDGFVVEVGIPLSRLIKLKVIDALIN